MTHIYQQLKREREEFEKFMNSLVKNEINVEQEYEDEIVNVTGFQMSSPREEEIESFLHASNLRIAKAVIEQMRREIGQNRVIEPNGVFEILTAEEQENYGSRMNTINQERSRIRLALDTLERSLEDKI